MCNICDYIQINIFNKGNFYEAYHQYVYNLNNDDDYNKDLCIITQVNGNHFNLIFDKFYNCYKNINKELLFNINHNSFANNDNNCVNNKNVNKMEPEINNKENINDSKNDINKKIVLNYLKIKKGILNESKSESEDDESNELEFIIQIICLKLITKIY